MKIKITNQEAGVLAEAIGALDGGTVTQVVEGRAVAVQRGYRLGHAARWALARNLGRLQSALADFQRARSSLIREHTGGGEALSAAHPGFAAFAREFEKLLQEPAELDLEPVRLEDLKLEANEQAGNEVPIGVLNSLLRLINQEHQ
jgi:hypothetical protein